jgi:SAM-dependent methyltransferase
MATLHAMPDIAPLHADLVFHGPLSPARADQLILSLGPLGGRQVVDLGCGWAELLLRTVATEPTVTGYGIDTDAVAIEHGRANATARGLADRVVLDVGDAAAWTGDADVLIVNGATHVWGGDPAEHTGNALAAAHARLRPGGRLLLGEGFWQREPEADRLAAAGIPRDSTAHCPIWWTSRWATDTGRCGSRKPAWPSGTSSSRGTRWAGNDGYWPIPAPLMRRRSGPRPTGTARHGCAAGVA